MSSGFFKRLKRYVTNLWYLALWPVAQKLIDWLVGDAVVGQIKDWARELHLPNLLLSVFAAFSNYPVRSCAVLTCFIVSLSALMAGVESQRAERRPKVQDPGPDVIPAPPRTESLNVQLRPSAGPSNKMLLAVINNGSGQKFHATCRLVARRNDPNKLHERTYDLAWERGLLREVVVVSKESCNLVIAIAENDRSTDLSEVKLQGFGSGSNDTVASSRWHEFEKGDKPEYDLEISVFGEGDQFPTTELFTLRCGGKSSALEMVRKQPATATRSVNASGGLATLKSVTYRGSGEERKAAFENRPKLFLEYSPAMAATYALTYSGLSLKNDGGIAYNIEFKPEIRAGFTLVLENPISPVEKGAPYSIKARFCRVDSKGTKIPMDGMHSIQVQSLMEALSEFGENSFAVTILSMDFEHNRFESCSQIHFDIRTSRIWVGLG
jgi:hypothetical protein